MGQEIELKLSIDEADVDRLAHHPFIVRHAEGPAVRKYLINHYFDTPEQILRLSAMALRVRFDGSVYVQTLKQKGESRNGLTVRGEWEWAVNGPDPDLTRVPPDIWPPAVKSCLDRLAPAFRTEFQRTLWTLKIDAEAGSRLRTPARVEMALDRGMVTTAAKQGAGGEEPILEVEFELLEGDTEALFEMSRLLGEEIHLTPSNISKAERGYRLLNLG